MSTLASMRAATHPILIKLGAPSHLAGSFLDRHPDVRRALEDAGASLVVFSVPRVYDDEGEELRDDFPRAAQTALEEAEASLPEDAGTPIFVCECLMSTVATILFGPAARERSEEALPLSLRPRRGLYGGVIALGEGGVLMFDAAGRRLAGWDGPREAVLERIRSLS